MRTLLVCLILLAVPTTASAQPEDAAEAIRATLSQLFDGMRAGDSTAVRAVFAPGATLQTAGSDTLRRTPVDQFVTAVGRPHDKVWDERIWDVEIQVDGPMASAWVPYAFYHGASLSHCGVNAMQLVRRDGHWQILHLTDTRHPADTCDIPADVKK